MQLEMILLALSAVIIIILLVRVLMLSKASQKIKSSFEQMQLELKAFQSSFFPSYYKDKHGKVLSVNKSFNKEFGSSQNDAIKRIEEFHGTMSTETILPYDNGHRKDVMLYQNNFLDTNNDILGSVGVIIDIAQDKKEKKTILETKNRLQHALENAEEGYWEWEIKTDSAYYSKKWKELMGYTYEDSEPKNLSGWLNLVDSLDMSKVNEKIKKYIDGHTDILDVDHRLKTFEEERWVNVRAKALRDFKDNPIKLVGTIRDITQTKKNEKELEAQKNLFSHFMDSLPVLSFIKDKAGKFLYMNEAYHKHIGFNDWREKSIQDLFPKDIAQNMLDCDREAIYEAISEHEEIVPDSQGNLKLFKTHKMLIESKPEDVLCGIGIDITKEARLKESNSLYTKILNATKSSIVILDASKKILQVNKVFEKVSGFLGAEVESLSIDVRNSSKHESGFYTKLWEEVENKGEWRGKLFTKNKDGSEDNLEVTNIYAIYNQKGKAKNYFIISQGLQREKFIQKSISDSLDPLTNLPNKTAFMQMLDQAISKTQRNQEIFALLYINIDDFTILNSSVGDDGSKQALKEVARKLSYHIRQHDTLAKLDNDEFAIILENITSTSDITMVCQRVLEEMTKPVKLENFTEILSVSIGVSIYPNHATEAKKLIDFAHSAMYKSKREGKNMFTVYKS